MLENVWIKVLTVGIERQQYVLDAVPIQVISRSTGMEAIESLCQSWPVGGLVSRWDLPDMTEGELIRRVKPIWPHLPIIVVLDEPYDLREPLVRSMGVVAVLPGNAHHELLCQIIRQIVKLDEVIRA